MAVKGSVFATLMVALCSSISYGTRDQALSLPYTCTTTTRLCQSGETGENHLSLDSGSSTHYGRPGKRGIRGPKGEKGDSCGCGDGAGVNVLPQPTLAPPVVKGMKGSKGEPGSSETNSEELQEMRAKIERLEAEVNKVQITESSTSAQAQGILDSARLLSPFPKSCSDLQQRKGANLEKAIIYPFLSYHDITPVTVNCSDGGWITIQRRINGSTTFTRSWRDYTEGFGNKNGEFWFGLKFIHRLTSQHPFELYIHFKFKTRTTPYFARYGVFYVGNELSSFRMVVGDYSGNHGDALYLNNGMRFSTYDQDHDETSVNCAQTRKGGWWFKNCGYSDLNGNYQNYFSWSSSSLSFSEMKIRQRC